jgi:hypothetical protein
LKGGSINCHSSECRNLITLIEGIPAFAGMTKKEFLEPPLKLNYE